jgi:hypothetical protein
MRAINAADKYLVCVMKYAAAAVAAATNFSINLECHSLVFFPPALRHESFSVPNFFYK